MIFLLSCCSELQFFRLIATKYEGSVIENHCQNCHFVRLIAQPGVESIFSLVYLAEIPNSIELLCTLEWKKVAENKHEFQRIFPPKNRIFWRAMYFWLYICTYKLFVRNFSISKNIENLQNRNSIWIDVLILKEIWFLENLLMEEESLIALNPPYVDGKKVKTSRRMTQNICSQWHCYWNLLVFLEKKSGLFNNWKEVERFF